MNIRCACLEAQNFNEENRALLARGIAHTSLQHSKKKKKKKKKNSNQLDTHTNMHMQSNWNISTCWHTGTQHIFSHNTYFVYTQGRCNIKKKQCKQSGFQDMKQKAYLGDYMSFSDLFCKNTIFRYLIILIKRWIYVVIWISLFMVQNGQKCDCISELVVIDFESCISCFRLSW